MTDYLNENLESSEKGLRFVPSSGLLEVGKVLEVPNKVPGKPNFYVVEGVVTETNDEDNMQVGAVYSILKTKGTKYGTDLILGLVAAAEGKPTSDPSYRGKVTITKKEFNTETEKVEDVSREVPAINVVFMRLFSEDKVLKDFKLQRLDLTGAVVKYIATANPYKDKVTGEDKVGIEVTFAPAKKAKPSKAVKAEDLIPQA